MKAHFLSIIIAVFAYSLLDVSKAIQKLGIRSWPKSRLKGGSIWFGGIAGTTVSSFLILYALSIGSVVIIGALAGTGLVAMMVFARLAMKEPISRYNTLSVIAILAGPFCMAGASLHDVSAQVSPRALYIFIGIVLVLCIVSLIVFRKKRTHGIIIAGTAGALSGFVVIFQKISTTDFGQASSIAAKLGANHSDLFIKLAKIFLNPYAAAWVLLSVVATIILQFAHRVEHAVRTVPTFGAANVLIPVLAGFICFGEHLRVLEWTGVALVLTGIGLLVAKPPKVAVDDP